MKGRSVKARALPGAMAAVVRVRARRQLLDLAIGPATRSSPSMPSTDPTASRASLPTTALRICFSFLFVCQRPRAALERKSIHIGRGNWQRRSVELVADVDLVEVALRDT